jgi:hypothetical protein
MRGARFPSPIGAARGLAATLTLAFACSTPTEPSAAAVRFSALRDAPAWTSGATRDSVFAAQLGGSQWNSGFAQGGSRVARTPERWATLWDTVVASVWPRPATPAIDFDTEMVVLAAHGAAATGGYAIEILHVTRQQDTTFVLVRTVRPGRTCVTTQAVTSPIAARVVPLAPPPTQFLVEPTEYDCEARRLSPLW